MAAKEKPLIEDGRVNIKLGARRIIEGLPVGGKELKTILFALNNRRMISIREMLGQSGEEFIKEYNIPSNVMDALTNRLTEYGLHFGMTQKELVEYSKTGKIQTQPRASQIPEDGNQPSLPDIPAEDFKHATETSTPEKDSSPSGPSDNSVKTPAKPKKPSSEVDTKKTTSPEKKTKAKNPSTTPYEKQYGDTERTRRNMLFFRVSDDERTSIKAGADACDMKISAYVRELVLGKTPRTAMTDEERKLFMDMREMLTNLRQMRNYFNKNRKDPKVWEKLTTVVNFMNNKIQDMKS